MSRLFIAVWPPPAVVHVLRDLPREVDAGIRWTTPDQWHITLRYLGKVDETVALDAFRTIEARSGEAVVGPTVERLGAAIVMVPVSGLDEIASVVAHATSGIGEPPHPDGFRGHLTLARLKDEVASSLDGVEVAARFAVDEIALVRSELHADGARYTTVARRDLST